MNQHEGTTNIAETLAREMKQPIGLVDTDNYAHLFALPEGWRSEIHDMEKYASAPRRMRGTEIVHDAESFCNRFHALRQGATSIWCNHEYNHEFAVLAIINDGDNITPGWCDHALILRPKFADRWKTWSLSNGKMFDQRGFAEFIENNIADIAPDTTPSGADMLHMALTMESVQNVTFKSGLRLQDGTAQLTYIEQSDDKTVAKMEVFYRFNLGVPVLHGGLLYGIEARLRYRIKDGALVFWYELDRPERVIEAATMDMVAAIKEDTGLFISAGTPINK